MIVIMQANINTRWDTGNQLGFLIMTDTKCTQFMHTDKDYRQAVDDRYYITK